MKTYNLGIIGCGDFLRWQADSLIDSKNVKVKSLFDPMKERAQKFADMLGGSAVDSSDEIMTDPEIDIVCLFVPPWLRKDLVVKAVENGKQILATKPLGATIEDCEAMKNAVGDSVSCGVIYRRTGYAACETYKKIFESGEVGNLALYKQDWLHHYPEWNTWATDPEKNGGPFMDAMIHNMNIAKYLMSSNPAKCTFFSDKHAHDDMACGDTELMKLDFANGESAHLFITWAADLAVYSKEGNDREHIDITYMITDKGWRLTDGDVDGVESIIASKDGQTKSWPVESINGSIYDRFAAFLAGNAPWPSDLPDVKEAAADIKLVRTAYKNNEVKFTV